MKEILLRNWQDLIANVPSWIDQKTVPIRYAKHGVGLVIEVPEVKPKLNLPVMPMRVINAPVTRFTKAVVAYYISQHCGSCRNYAVLLNGVWQHVANPFIVYEHKRIYITADELEAVNLLWDISQQLASTYMAVLATRHGEPEETPPEPQTGDQPDTTAFGL